MNDGDAMMQQRQDWPQVSIIIVNYNGLAYLDACLTSVFAQAYPNFEVILVDNGSVDGSVAWVEENFLANEDHLPLTVVRSEENVGFGHANNLGARHATGEYLAFLNPDTVVTESWLYPLVDVLEQQPDVGLATAKILLSSHPDRINTCGNEVHFTGFPACRGWMWPAQSVVRVEDVGSISGAAFVMRRAVFELLGGFDGRFFLYVEDNDLSWRAHLTGYRSVCVPDAVIYHKYAPRFEPQKYFYLERNRYLLLLKNLERRTLLLLLPALLLAEVIAWGYAILHGPEHVCAKVRAYRWVFAHWQETLAARRSVQSLRRASDRVILARCAYRPAYGLAQEGWMSRIAGLVFDPLFGLLYRAAMAGISG